jgi:hypothetical protein
MAQYSAGTISVTANSNVVTGTGTTFQTSGIKAGDLLLLDNDQAAYEVASITSNTSLKITGLFSATRADINYLLSKDFTPNRGYPLVSTRDQRAADVLRRALVKIDSDAQFGLTADGVVKNVLNSPPGSPATNDRYIVGTSPTGDWSGKANFYATWSGSAWVFVFPTEKTYVYDQALASFRLFYASAWRIFTMQSSGAAIGSTDDLTEGTTNLFHTLERAQDAAAGLLTSGNHSAITFTYDDGTAKINATITLNGVGTTAQRLASSPVAGSCWYDSTFGFLVIYDGAYWRKYDGSRIESYITITNVAWTQSSYAIGDVLGVNITFSAAVNIPAGSSIIVSRTNGGNLILYAAAQTNVTTAVFNKAIDNTTSYIIPNATNTFSLASQTITGSIKETGTTFDPQSKTISSGQASGAGSKSVTATAAPAAVILSANWNATGGVTNSTTVPHVSSNNTDAHAWIEVNFDRAVDVLVGASINVVRQEDGVYWQETLYAAAQSNVTKVKFEYTNAGATTLFYLSHGGSIGYEYTACANGSSDDNPDFPYSISGTIYNASTTIVTDKSIASNEFVYYRIDDGY